MRPSLRFPKVLGMPVRLSEEDRLQTFETVSENVLFDFAIFANDVQEACFAALGACSLTHNQLSEVIAKACPDIDPIAADLILKIMLASGEIARRGPNYFSPESATGATIGNIAILPQSFDNFRLVFGDLAREHPGTPISKAALHAALACNSKTLTSWIARALDEGLIEKVRGAGASYRYPRTKAL